MKIFAFTFALVALLVTPISIKAEDSYLKLRYSNQNEFYHILETAVHNNINYEHKFFQDDNNFWVYTPAFTVKIIDGIRLGPSAQLNSLGEEKLGLRANFIRLETTKYCNTLLYLEAAHLLSTGGNDSYYELFGQLDFMFKTGFQFSLQSWYVKEGEFEQLHISPARIGWNIKHYNKATITPFIMWRPVFDKLDKWENKYYFGVDILF
jgi:hypothetical protein